MSRVVPPCPALSHYARELEVARAAARAAADVLRRHYEEGTEEWQKGEDDPVTAADLEADRVIRLRLREAFPEDGLLSEEHDDGTRRSARRVWIVDPMDGTKEFLARVPEFAVSIALVEDGEPVVGVVHNPIADVAVWATRGGGTFRDGQRTAISRCNELSEAVLVASRSETRRGDLNPYEGWFKELRPTGSIAWKLAVVASGPEYGDLNVSLRPKSEWDVCAGDLVVREAGGRYLDFDGNPPRYNRPDPLIDRPMAAGPEPLLDKFFTRDRELQNVED